MRGKRGTKEMMNESEKIEILNMLTDTEKIIFHEYLLTILQKRAPDSFLPVLAQT